MGLLLPTKHSHPDKTVIAIAYIAIGRLKKVRIEKYDDLLSHLNKKNPDSNYLFIYAINFLYLFNLIKYHIKTDSFEYVGP